MTRVPLAGRGIVITRPREQAQGLAALVEAAGGVAILFPAIEIRDVDPAPLAAVLDGLEAFDVAVFVSPTAAQKGLDLVRRHRGGKPWPATMRVAAIGRGSRRELERQGLRGIIAPQGPADSESLLAMPQMQELAGRRAVIFRGDGGRELLGETLAARGVEVVYAECYRRVRPDLDASPLLAARARGALHAVTVSSAEGLANLVAMLGEPGRRLLLETPLFVPHARVAAAARGLDAGVVRVAGPSDEEMHAALVAYFAAAQ